MCCFISTNLFSLEIPTDLSTAIMKILAQQKDIEATSKDIRSVGSIDQKTKTNFDAKVASIIEALSNHFNVLPMTAAWSLHTNAAIAWFENTFKNASAKEQDEFVRQAFALFSTPSKESRAILGKLVTYLSKTDYFKRKQLIHGYKTKNIEDGEFFYRMEISSVPFKTIDQIVVSKMKSVSGSNEGPFQGEGDSTVTDTLPSCATKLGDFYLLNDEFIVWVFLERCPKGKEFFLAKLTRDDRTIITTFQLSIAK